MRLLFRQLTLDDSESFHEWLSDYEVIKYSQGKFLRPYSNGQIKDWLKAILVDCKSVNFAITLADTNKIIGYAGIADLSEINHSGEFYILIGDKTQWNKGYGQEVSRAIVDYGFRVLMLHRIQLTVSNINIGGVVAYKKAGFVEEGVLRDASYRDGSYHDKIIMSIIK